MNRIAYVVNVLANGVRAGEETRIVNLGSAGSEYVSIIAGPFSRTITVTFEFSDTYLLEALNKNFKVQGEVHRRNGLVTLGLMAVPTVKRSSTRFPVRRVGIEGA